MSAFYSQSFPKRENAVESVRECIDTMKGMDVKVAFLPMGIKEDLVKHPEVRPDIVKRLKEVGRSAEKAGVIIGIETSLDAAGEVKLLDDIGSNAIQSYFNFENPVQAGRNLYKELKILGKKRICHIHCTDKDGVWLQNGLLIDMNKVKSILNTMGWSGWLVMQRSRDAKDPHNIILNYGTNASYLKKVFQS